MIAHVPPLAHKTLEEAFEAFGGGLPDATQTKSRKILMGLMLLYYYADRVLTLSRQKLQQPSGVCGVPSGVWCAVCHQVCGVLSGVWCVVCHQVCGVWGAIICVVCGVPSSVWCVVCHQVYVCSVPSGVWCADENCMLSCHLNSMCKCQACAHSSCTCDTHAGASDCARQLQATHMQLCASDYARQLQLRHTCNYVQMIVHGSCNCNTLAIMCASDCAWQLQLRHTCIMCK